MKKQAVAELIPDPKAEGAITAEAFAVGVGGAGDARGPRPDPHRHPSRRPRLQERSAPITCKVDLLPRVHGSALVPARRDAGAGDGDPGHRPRRAARRRPGRGILAEVHAALLLPAVLGGRVPADSRSGPPRDRPRGAGRAERQAGAARARRLPLHHPHHLRHPGEQRLQLDGQRVRGDAGADGRRRAHQQSRGRHLRRAGEGARPLRPADRHHRRRGPLRRHGLQSGRHAKRHHRHPARPEDRRHQRGDHPRHAEAIARGADRDPPQHAHRDLAAAGRTFRRGRRGCCARTSIPRRSAC